MHDILTNFTKILDVIKDIIVDEINKKGHYLIHGTIPKFSDIEVIALSHTAECPNIDRERTFYSGLPVRKMNEKQYLYF